MDEKVDLIAGRLNNRNGETLYWKLEKMMSCKLGDFAVVENANGYWYPKFSMKNMSFHISTEEYELKRKIDNLEIEKKVYIDDKNK